MKIKPRFCVSSMGLSIILFLSALTVRSQTFDNTTPLDALRAAAKNGKPAAEDELARRLIEGKARSPEAARILQDAQRDVQDAYTHYTAEPVEGATTFSVDEIKDLRGLEDRLKRHADPISAYLWPRLSDEARTLMEFPDVRGSSATRIHEAVVQSLNRLIDSSGMLYYEPVFKDVSLRPETTNLMEQSKNPNSPNLARLNRLVLEDAYPVELPRKPTIDDSSTSSKLKKEYQQQQDRYNKLKASVEENETKEAVQFCEDAVRQGNVDSMLLLASFCETGTGMPTNFARAVDLNRKAAELGTSAAMDNLGLDYAAGKGVTKDMNEAVNWFERAIAKGYYRAVAHLADILLDGGLNGKDDGYQKNPRRAYALGRALQLVTQQGSLGYQLGAAIVQKARQGLEPDQLMAAETEAEKVRQQLIVANAKSTAQPPVINLKNSTAITKKEWKEAFAKSYPVFSKTGSVIMQKDEFLKLCGEPSKTQTVGNKTSWYYTCKDGEIQLELDKGNLLGGIVAGQVNDY